MVGYVVEIKEGKKGETEEEQTRSWGEDVERQRADGASREGTIPGGSFS